MVELQLPKLNVAGSIPVSLSNLIFPNPHTALDFNGSQAHQSLRP